MSNIYIQEPPTNGKVLLKTSCGELDIELWSKEAPRACRNFIQLCMEGYYDGTIFHRIIRNFMAQGGDPTGTGEGGESIYGHPFRDEFHSRLRFVRRGLVAMANAGPHDNGSQFFITLGPCEHLQGKHTIFGKITGNTIYNAAKLGEVDIGEDDRPVYPPKIKSTQILANPFDDIIPRQLKKKQEKEEKKPKSKAKATKNFSLLSFGEEAEEDEEETVVASQSMKNKSKSAHDLVKDPNLSSLPAVEIEKENKPSVEERLHPKPTESDEDVEEEETHHRNQLEKKKETTDKIRSKLTKERKKSEEESVKESAKEEKTLSRKEELQEESRKLKEELREGRKRKQKEESHQEQAKLKQDEETVEEKSSDKVDELEEFHAQKKKFKAMKKTMAKKGSSREEQTLAMLAKFQNKLHSAILNKKPEPETKIEEKEEGEYMEGEEEEEMKEKEEEGDDWLVHSLQFETHDNKVKDANVRDADTFTIFDPRNPMNKRRREDSKQKKKKDRR